jgi:hypothetical protein
MTTPAGTVLELQPGLYQGVDAMEYHRWKGASQSRLKILRDKSPLHLKYEMDHPSEPTDAMVLGAAVHTCVLEPDAFHDLYKRAPDGDRRRKGVKEMWARMEAEYPEAAILKTAEFDTCMAIRDSVAKHPIAKHVLEGETERSAAWHDPDTGVLCRGRFDDIARGVKVLTDLKTTSDASPHQFPHSIYKYGYHIQGAHYLRGAKQLDLDLDSFAIVAVEKEPPWAVAVYQLNAAAIFDGERELLQLLDTWARCERDNVWPGYAAEVVAVDLPKWAPGQISDRIGEAA